MENKNVQQEIKSNIANTLANQLLNIGRASTNISNEEVTRLKKEFQKNASNMEQILEKYNIRDINLIRKINDININFENFIEHELKKSRNNENNIYMQGTVRNSRTAVEDIGQCELNDFTNEIKSNFDELIKKQDLVNDDKVKGRENTKYFIQEAIENQMFQQVNHMLRNYNFQNKEQFLLEVRGTLKNNLKNHIIDNFEDTSKQLDNIQENVLSESLNIIVKQTELMINKEIENQGKNEQNKDNNERSNSFLEGLQAKTNSIGEIADAQQKRTDNNKIEKEIKELPSDVIS